MVGRAAALTIRALLLAVLAASPATTFAQEMQVRAACRDGLPHGAYELREAGGQLRVAGAFNRGKRTSSFIFWTATGVRVAHIPYDDGVRSGTVSLWYADAPRGGDAQQKLESSYTAGVLDGPTRSWHPEGRARTAFVYTGGTLVEAKAWNAAGAPLTDAAARALAARDSAADERYYSSLDALVAAHPPPCDEAAVPRQSAQAASTETNRR